MSKEKKEKDNNCGTVSAEDYCERLEDELTKYRSYAYKFEGEAEDANARAEHLEKICNKFVAAVKDAGVSYTTGGVWAVVEEYDPEFYKIYMEENGYND